MRPHARILRWLCLAFACLAASRAAADTQRLVVLLVIDTNAARRGGDDVAHRYYAEANLRLWRGLLDGVYGSGPLFRNRLWVNVIKDHDVGPEAIRRFYRNMGYDPNCALLFVYSGHGAVDARKGQFFATSGGDISRSEVRKLMEDRGAPAVFILSDCCSSYVPMGHESSDDSPPDLGPRPTPNWAAFYRLFYQHRGVVELTAARQGEVAFAGLCTTAMVGTLYAANHQIRADGRQGPVTWSDYFRRVQQRTGFLFAQARNSAPYDHPLRHVRGQWPVLSLGVLAPSSQRHGWNGPATQGGRFGPAIPAPPGPRDSNQTPFGNEDRTDRIERTDDP